MAKKIWRFELGDGEHTVELEHGYWSGKRVIRVDGERLERTRRLVDSGSQHAFEIDGHPCAVHIRTNGITFTYDLVVGGRSVETGEPVTPSPPIPRWAWAFAVACGVIPLVTLGGAIPAAIGAGGAVGCVSLARNPARPVWVRVGLCVGVTVLCWVLTLVTLMVFGLAGS